MRDNLRLFKQKQSNLRSVKTSLKSIIPNKDQNNKSHKLPERNRDRLSELPFLQQDINNVVIRVNRLLDNLQNFIKLFILHQFHEGEELPVINKNFVSTCIRILNKKNKQNIKNKDKFELKEKLGYFYDNIYTDIHKEKHDLSNLCYVINYLENDIVKNVNTNIKEHYIQRLAKYIRIFAGKIYDNNREEIDKNERKNCLNRLVTAILNNNYSSIEPEFEDWFNEINGIVLPEELEKNVRYDIKANTENYLRYTIEICYQFEKENEENEKKIKSLQKKIKNKKKTLKKNDKILDKIRNINKEKDELVILNKHIDTEIQLSKRKIKNTVIKMKKVSLRSKIKELKEDYGENKKEITRLDNKVKNIRRNRTLDPDITKWTDKIKLLNKSKIRLFNILPLSHGFVPNSISFDTIALIDLFYHGKKKTNLKKFVNEHKERWEIFFNMEDKNMKNTKEYNFDYFLRTDGLSCNLLFRKKGQPKGFGKKIKEIKNEIVYIDDLDEDKLKLLENRNIVCVDPGKKDILYMVDQNGNVLKLSANQRRAESKSLRNQKIVLKEKRRNLHIQDLETKLSKYNSKSVMREGFENYLIAREEVAPKLYKYYENILFRKLRFRTSVYKQKSMDRFLNKIKETFGDNIVICIGDWSNRNRLNGFSTLGVGIKKEIAKRYDFTLLIDEYKTSKLCHGCSNELENVYIKEKKIYRLKGCRTCSTYNTERLEGEDVSVYKSCKYINRDKNACLNMIKLAEHMIRTGGERIPEYNHS